MPRLLATRGDDGPGRPGSGTLVCARPRRTSALRKRLRSPAAAQAMEALFVAKRPKGLADDRDPACSLPPDIDLRSSALLSPTDVPAGLKRRRMSGEFSGSECTDDELARLADRALRPAKRRHALRADSLTSCADLSAYLSNTCQSLALYRSQDGDSL